MSDSIPLEIQVEIIKRSPIESLLRFRSVSKQWKSLIDSSEFATDYRVRHAQPNRLLIRYTDPNEFKTFTVSVVDDDDDDDTFTLHKFATTPVLDIGKIVGCSHGLLCLRGYDSDERIIVYLWNPLIRKSVSVPVPNVPLRRQYKTVLGFGVCPHTNDPKIVKINSIRCETHPPIACIPWQVDVFTLSSGTWRTPYSSNMPRTSLRFNSSQVSLDGFIYWHAFDTGSEYKNLIMSFDLTTEEFGEIDLPDNLARLNQYTLSISKRVDSVVVLERDFENGTYGVWMMEQGVTKSFTKLFNVMTRGSSSCSVCGFRKNGEPIVDLGSNALFALDPYSGRINELGILGRSFSFSVESYTTTLLLIRQRDRNVDLGMNSGQ